MSTDNKISRRDALKRMGAAVLGGAVASSGLLSLTSCEGKRNKRIIFYFTGTGNCLYIARQLAGADTELLSIPQMVKRGKYEFEADEIGIVYPIYGHMPPYMVRQFIQKARLKAGYKFAVLTYGARKCDAVEIWDRISRKAGNAFDYIGTIVMVDNWLPNFDMDEQRARIPEKKIGENLERIRADVATRRRWIEPVTDRDRAAHEQFMSRGLRFEPAMLGGFLTVDSEKCVGCGACAKVCPAGCIALEGGKAVRNAQAGFGCNACLACMHACPAHAITCAVGDKNPAARFRNEHVTLAELQEANSGS